MDYDLGVYGFRFKLCSKEGKFGRGAQTRETKRFAKAVLQNPQFSVNRKLNPKTIRYTCKLETCCRTPGQSS